MFLFSCEKEEVEPTPPVINYINLQLSANNQFTKLTFGFYDADGDLGLKQNENTGEQEFNLFVDYYEKHNGSWVLKSPLVTWNNNENKFDTVDLHLRIPFIDNKSGKALEGETEVDLLYDFNAPSFRYEIYIKDRALHSSNTITTPEIFVN